MLKEIHEQRVLYGITIAGRLLEDEGMCTLKTCSSSDRQLAAVKRIIIIACGTSLGTRLWSVNFYIEGALPLFLFEWLTYSHQSSLSNAGCRLKVRCNCHLPVG